MVDMVLGTIVPNRECRFHRGDGVASVGDVYESVERLLGGLSGG